MRRKYIQGGDIEDKGVCVRMDFKELRKTYRNYTQTVSPTYSISWRASVYLLELIEKLKPKRILDLGSGWSSYLFRLDGAEVWSADHDRMWLEKTKTFLRKFSLEDERLIMIEDVNWGLDYDLVLVDHGPTTRGRAELFGRIKACCTGVVVFDDAEIHGYNEDIKASFKDWRLEWLRKRTMERRKFLAVAYRKKNP